jgi:hypothetical protein
VEDFSFIVQWLEKEIQQTYNTLHEISQDASPCSETAGCGVGCSLLSLHLMIPWRPEYLETLPRNIFEGF